MLKDSLYRILKSSKILSKLYWDSIFSDVLHNSYHCSSWKIKMIKQRINEIPRFLGCNQKLFAPILEYKNKYKGKRCFITCTGPSLTIADLELLKDEYVFGMNSIAKIHDKTEWKPDFYGIEDAMVYENLKDFVRDTDNGQIFYSHKLSKISSFPEGAIPYFSDSAYHLYEVWHGKYFAHFSTNCYVRVFDGYSVTYSLIQLAVYMGFKEIYLLGADCNYMGEKKHFIDTGVNNQTVIVSDSQIAAFTEALNFATKNGIKIFNATRGGKLEVFPRIALEEVLSESRNNKTNK